MVRNHRLWNIGDMVEASDFAQLTNCVNLAVGVDVVPSLFAHLGNMGFNVASDFFIRDVLTLGIQYNPNVVKILVSLQYILQTDVQPIYDLQVFRALRRELTHDRGDFRNISLQHLHGISTMDVVNILFRSDQFQSLLGGLYPMGSYSISKLGDI